MSQQITQSAVRGIAQAQNALNPVFVSADAQILAAAQSGLFTVDVTLEGDDMAFGAILKGDLESRSFEVSAGGDESAVVLTISWNF
jgi:hypothetical protein